MAYLISMPKLFIQVFDRFTPSDDPLSDESDPSHNTSFFIPWFFYSMVYQNNRSNGEITWRIWYLCQSYSIVCDRFTLSDDPLSDESDPSHHTSFFIPWIFYLMVNQNNRLRTLCSEKRQCDFFKSFDYIDTNDKVDILLYIVKGSHVHKLCW